MEHLNESIDDRIESASLECGCDLECMLISEDGELYSETYALCHLCEYLDLEWCFWARDIEDSGNDILIYKEN